MIKFNKNYFSHEFESINEPFHFANDYICAKCNIRIVFDPKLESEQYREVDRYGMYEKCKITCAEQIIKNIIE